MLSVGIMLFSSSLFQLDLSRFFVNQMIEQASSLVVWYGFVLVVGWGSFPLAFRLFRDFPDRGYAFAKTLGLLLVAYLTWMVSSLGIAPYQWFSIGLVLGGYGIGNLLLVRRDFRAMLSWWRAHLRPVLLMEGVFLVVFLGGVVVRMYNPEITGAEKEADLTLLNAVVQSTAFPPPDTWFAGETVNYYYFGYVIWGTMIKATGIRAAVGFNLALATIMALGAVGMFGIVFHVTRRRVWGGLGICLLVVFGNLDGLIQIVERHGRLLPFDWWRSSRVIPDTINEFPYFSFLLGDLHAHFMAIPFVLLLVGLLAQLLSTLRRTLRQEAWPELGVLACFASLSLGSTAVINSWDYPTALLLTGACVGIGLCVSETAMSAGRRGLLGVALFGSIVAVSRLAFWPFYQHFTPQITASALRLVSPLQRTELRYFFIIYGLFLFVLASFFAQRVWLAMASRPRLSREKRLVWGNVVLLAVALVVVCTSLRVLLLALGISGGLLYALYREIRESSRFVLPFVLLALAFLIVAGCELVYIKDFYGHPLERQNTIFKFYYQAWMLLAIGVPCLLALMARRQQRFPATVRHGWKAAFVLFCGIGLIYPALATYEKTNQFRSREQGGPPYVPTLDGIRYLAFRHPAEYDALRWIQEHLAPDAVILEATGRPYSFFGRVATTTGRRTVLGWGNHEALWRDQSWQSILERTEDIRRIYETPEKSAVLPLLEQYGVEYIYVGTLERETYDRRGLEAFGEAFPVVYENRGVRIYGVGGGATD
ncbi:hypothetical protein GF339_00750 [candidate division KSB3 bacterium]|uniref:Chlor_Arch_YYY domain-containing protein n=1 Tax=candidate division KSB3 bacterium TaxID=2044937 RepID=A0A9D5JS99_9BACT|nr:hypothetical protein [candidate division KSB3 bacterium]MBD3323077.1 hypothetical protein [candidate division KSB3 bacterium]